MNKGQIKWVQKCNYKKRLDFYDINKLNVVSTR